MQSTNANSTFGNEGHVIHYCSYHLDNIICRTRLQTHSHRDYINNVRVSSQLFIVIYLTLVKFIETYVVGRVFVRVVFDLPFLVVEVTYLL